jgi:multicomponent Na+:H+ antiporter subunit D
MPLHSWLPAAMVAPTPVSALLHAVAVVKSGVFGVLRVAGFVFGWEVMREHGLDLMLAASPAPRSCSPRSSPCGRTTSRRGWPIRRSGTFLHRARRGAALAGRAARRGAAPGDARDDEDHPLLLRRRDLRAHPSDRDLAARRLGRKMPWTFGAFAVGALGLAGMPPVNGFVSKWWLCLGTLEAGQQALGLAVFLLSGLLNAGYLFPIVVRAFFASRRAAHDGGAWGESRAEAGEASPWMVVPLVTGPGAGAGRVPGFSIPFFELARRVVRGGHRRRRAGAPEPDPAKPIHWILLGLLNAASLGPHYFGPEHPHPACLGRGAVVLRRLYGFVGCILIIVVSKALGKALLQKREDYYERDR